MLIVPSILILSPSPAAAQLSPPHIIILLADDLGWGDVGYHGSKIATPHIDRLASMGTRLNQFYVQPVCSPTRAAMLTGRYPMRLGLQCGVVRPWADYGLPLDERTMAEELKEIGYQTAIVGKWHLGHFKPEYLPTRRGFTQQYGHYNGALDYFTHDRDGGHDWHKNDKRNDDEGYTTDLIGREAVRIIKDHPTNRPLFLYVPFNAPHTPLQAPKAYLDKASDFKEKDRQTYAAMVMCMDDAVGDIVEAIEAMPDYLAGNTIIFFCSDNGGIRKLGSNGDLRAGKGTLYEGGVRVPAVMVWHKHLKPGSEVNEPLHIVDLYPTLVGRTLMGPKKGKMLDGRDAWPTIAKGAASPHEYILHNVTPFGGALRMGDFKIIHYGQHSANATAKPDKEEWELFNIKDDPSEKKDLKDDEREVFKKLKAKLEELAGEAVKPSIPPNQPPKGFAVPKVWGEGE